jgi:RimJ/RimL family protein N-acetyltransferase
MNAARADVTRRITWRSFTARLRNTPVARWIHSDRQLVVFRIVRPTDPVPVIPVGAVHRDDWSHLEKFEVTEHWLTREAFLGTAAERLSQGEHVYTIADAERLLSYGWLVPRQEASWLPAVEQELRYPPGAAVMYNACTHPSARGRGYNGLVTKARIADAFLEFGAQAVYTAIEPQNRAANRAKDGSGMAPWMELGCTRHLGRTVKTRRLLQDDPNA